MSFDRVIDSPMYRLPELPVPRDEFVLPPRAKELWLQALRRPDADMKCKAAHAIATAHRDGVAGFETTIPALLAAFDQPDQHPTVLLAVADALNALDARQAAESFFRAAQSGRGELRESVEPALARWDHRPARQLWLSRLREPATPSRNLTLAIRCLADVREEKAVEPLRDMVLSERVTGPVRLQAATGLGSLCTAGLEKDAERLSADASPRGLVARLAAASLLRQHRGPEAIALLRWLARDAEPAVAAPAVARLLELDPALLDSWVDDLLARRDTRTARDANLRLLAVEVLHRRPSEKNIHRLIARLDDEHSAVRVAARDHLFDRAEDGEWRGQILKEATGLLQTNSWRQIEQATILLVHLDHKPAAGLLVKLLDFDRPEVAITAAWGLRKLAVAETLPAVVRHVEARHRTIFSGGPPPGGARARLAIFRDHQLSQLIQFLGQQKHRPAEPLLRRFVPRAPNPAICPEGRAAAVWALGLIHEGGAPDDLATAAEERLNDMTSIPPESESVRRMAAVALGRWKAKKTLPSLRKHLEDAGTTVGACGWAIGQITGERVPRPEPVRKPRREWFLTPSGG